MKLSLVKIVLIVLALFGGHQMRGMEVSGIVEGIMEGGTQALEDGIGDGAKGLSDTIQQTLSEQLASLSSDAITALQGASEEALETLSKDIADLGTALSEDLTSGADLSSALKSFAEDFTDDFSNNITKNLPTDFAANFEKAFTSLDETLTASFNSLETLAEDTAPVTEVAGSEPAEVAAEAAPQPVEAAADGAAQAASPAAVENTAQTVSEAEGQAAQQASEAAGRPPAAQAAEAGAAAAKEGSLVWSALKWGGVTLASAAIFLVPNWVLSAVGAKEAKSAQIATIGAPQYWGGMWLQIPSDLIDTSIPSNTIPLYSLVTNPDANYFYSSLNAQVTHPTSWYPATIGEVNRGTTDDYNFFVTSGNYDDCTINNGAWGASTITGSSFASQMIHLNSGLEFIADGSPVPFQTNPFRQLAGTGSPTGSCKTTILEFLNAFSSKIAEGQSFVQTSGTAISGAGLFHSSGAVTQAQTTSKLAAYASKLYQESTATSLLDTKYQQTYAGEQSALSTWNRMSVPFNVGPASGGFSLSAVQVPDSSIVQVLGISQAPDSSNYLPQPAAQGFYVYQTADTPLARSMRKSLQSKTSTASSAAHFYDYLVPIGSNYTPVPGLIPSVNVAPKGVNDTTPGYVTWTVNHDIKYLYSLLDQTAYDASTGLPATIPGSISIAVPGDIQMGSVSADITNISNAVKIVLAQGPFVYGGYTVTIPTEVANLPRLQAPIYAVDPAYNQNKTTLEGLYADYIVPTDINFVPVAIPSPQHRYWVSLVTSRIYNTDLTLANGTVDNFTLTSIGKAGIFIATPQTLPAFQQKYGTSLQKCPKGENLTAPLATLYMEYDLNPFNATVIKVLPTLTLAITQALTKSTDPVYQPLASANTLSRFAAAAASDFVSSLQAAGLTPAIIQTMTTLTSDQINEIAAASAEAITEAIKQGMANGTFKGSSLASAAPTDISNLLSIKNPAISSATASVFAGLGSKTLASVLPPVVQPVFDNLYKFAGLDVGNFQSLLCQDGLIGIGPYYPYNYWALSAAVDSNGKPTGSYSTLASFASTNPSSPIFGDIASSHSRWKLWMVSQPQNQWELYANLGPFSFTVNGIPNVVIEPVSSAAIQAGDFVYQSPTQLPALAPGDYFIVASSLGAGNNFEETSLEPFNPTSPQPYLISLVTGTVYTRDAASTTINVFQENGQNVKIGNLNTVQNLIRTPAVRTALNITPQQIASGAGWKHYNFANFLLTINPQDIQNNTYVYQDVTTLTTFPPALSQVTDFFIAANSVKDKTTGKTSLGDLGTPLDNNPDYIISLVNGQSYSRKGGKAFAPIANAASFVNELPGGTPRSDLVQAIKALVAAQTKPAPTPTPPPVQATLDSATVAALFNDTDNPYLYGPFSHLKLYNGKYYGVTNPASIPTDTVQTIFDYSTKNIKTGTSGQTALVGILYDSSGNPMSLYDGTLLSIARANSGVVVNSDGSEVLGVPNQNQGITVKVCTSPGTGCTLFPFDTPLTAQMPEGTYTFYQYKANSNDALRVIAQVAPTTGTGYYVDMFSGNQYNLDGTPAIAQYPTLLYSGDSTIAAVIGLDTYNTPIAFAPDKDGNYQKWDYSNLMTSKTNTYLTFSTPSDEALAITPPVLDPTTQAPIAALDPTKQWTLYMGTIPSGGTTTTAKYDTTIQKNYGPATATGEQLRVYQYIGSGAPGSGTVFSVARATDNPNYEGELVIAGNGSGSAWKVTRIFMPPVLETAPGYLLLTPSATQSGQGVAYQTASGATTQYNATFFDGLVDAKTNGAYVAIQDTNGVHFYTPTYQTTQGSNLKAVQQKLNGYITTTAYGDVGIVMPVNTKSGLSPVQAVLNVPTSVTPSPILLQNFERESGTANRYLYVFQASDQKQVFFRTGASYVDLRMGVLYDMNGIPLGTSISYPELAALLLLYGVTVPQPSDDPTAYTPPAGREIYGNVTSSTTPFLWYNG